MSDLLNNDEDFDEEVKTPKRRKTDFLPSEQVQMYNTICNARFGRIENNQESIMPILQKINAKVNNGYDKDIKALHDKVDTIQSHTDEKIEDFKEENEREHKELKAGQDKMTKSLRNLIITIIVAGASIGGGIVATLLTGFFGLIEKLGGG